MNRKTRNPRIWLEYLCWKIQFWMNTQKPYYPLWLRVIILRHVPDTRYHMSWMAYRRWITQGWSPKPEYRPLPWYIGEAALGPLVKPWNRIARFFRAHTGGRSHRCEFTDPEQGALYGGREGGFMDRYFEIFIKNIDAENPINKLPRAE